MTWGYALVWAPQFMKLDDDPWMAKLKWLNRYGLKTTGISVEAFDSLEQAQREQISEYLDQHDMALTLAVWPDYLSEDLDRCRARVDQLVALVHKHQKAVRAPICTTGVASVNRFTADPSFEFQMDRLWELLPDLAAGCEAADAPLAIENHGDYYVSDLVPLFEGIQHLYLFLDTGNTYLIGEQPLPAFAAGAKYVIGGHFKDHVVGPRTDSAPLRFEIGPSVIGRGHVPLLEAWNLIREHCPRWDKLTMQIELIPPSFSGDDPIEAFEQSLDFVRSLPTVRNSAEAV